MTPLLFALLAAADPCAPLPEKDVRQIFEVPEMTPIRTVRADGCSYLWMGVPPSGPQLREALMKGRRLPARANESVSIRVEAVHHAVKELETRHDLLAKGYKIDRDGREMNVKPERLEWVPNVGDKAYWNGALSQLVVAHKDELLSIVVKKQLPPADLRQAATTVAQAALRRH